MPTPNLLFIFTDEQRSDTLACYGNQRLEMPHLNRLASQSTVIDQCYCTQPLCTPRRGSILTGLYPHAHGALTNNVPLHAHSRCLIELLPDAIRSRYVAGYHGKWHLGDEVFRQHGFDEWISIEDQYHPWYSPGRDRSQPSTYNQWLRKQGYKPDHGEFFGRSYTTTLPERAGKPAYLAQEASRFIREHQRDPFVLYVNFLEPHMPFFSPRDGQYDPATTPLPANFDAWPGDDCHLRTRLLAARFAAEGFERYDLSTEAGWRQMNAAYWGLCSLIDTHIGRILATLDDCGLAHNTIVVFTSDHGEMMGSHRLVGKSVMYQEAMRVPCLIRLPGQTRQQRITGPFSQIDLVPTLLDLMGAGDADALHGTSRAAMLRNGGGAINEDAMAVWTADEKNVGKWAIAVAGSEERGKAGMADSLRTIVTPDGWRYTHSASLGQHELFNLQHDPQERTNLAGRPEHRGLISDLFGRIKAWQKRVGDQLPLT